MKGIFKLLMQIIHVGRVIMGTNILLKENQIPNATQAMTEVVLNMDEEGQELSYQVDHGQ